MKHYIILAVALLSGSALRAQETMLNNYISNTSDLFGTARYVGMGGAMGALGADVSAITSNPAALGLFRRSTISLTFGGIRQSDTNAEDKSAVNASFDQGGFVLSFPSGDRGLKYINFGFNYQKRNSLTQTFIADDTNASLFDYLDPVRTYFGKNFSNPIVKNAEAAGLFGKFEDGVDPYLTKKYSGNRFMRTISGHVRGFDFNLSGNVDDRYFFGLTLGLNDLRYASNAYYDEYRGAAADKYDFSYNNYQEIRGTGFTMKLGFIARPFVESPFRVGIAIETPTWYKLSYRGESEFVTHFDQGTDTKGPFKHVDRAVTYRMDPSTLQYTLYTPWRFRVSAGHTFGTQLAVGVEYEYCDYGATKMGYPKSSSYYDGYRYITNSGSEEDRAMTKQTKASLQGVHSFKCGLEFKPVPEFAIRAGYNYFGASSKKGVHTDHTIDSYATEFVTGTDFMLLGSVNLITCGLGYAGKHFYADLAYKFRMQKAEFFPFHDYNATVQTSRQLNLDRHQLLLSLGYKF